MQGIRLRTARLEIVPGIETHVQAEIAGRKGLGVQLRAEVPENWPPDLYDRTAMEYALAYLRDHPDAPGWGLWYLLLRDPAGGRPTAIGITGFKGKPSSDGMVEIGYSILSQFQREGYASEAVAALVDWAFASGEVRRVIAETYPELVASIRVIEKSGFRFIGPGSEPRVIRYELPQGLHEARRNSR